MDDQQGVAGRDVQRRGRRVRSTGGLLLACLLAVAAYSTGLLYRPTGAAATVVYDLVLYNAVYVLGALICWRTAVRRRQERTLWLALAVSLAVAVLGTVAYALVLAPLLGDVPAWLLVALWLPLYPALGVALIGLVRSRVPVTHPSMWLDGLIGALGAVAAAVTVFPSMPSGAADGALAVAGLYPVFDTFLLAGIGAAGAVVGLRRDWPQALLLGGLICNLVGDSFYLSFVERGQVMVEGPIYLTWLSGAALTAVSAHVAGRSGRPVPALADPVARMGWRVLLVPFISNVISIAVLMTTWGVAPLGLAGCAAVGCLLATLARAAMSFQELRGLHEVREQARTDELTGLANRRALLEASREVLLTADTRNPAALLLLDLDGFKEVNDSLGHAAGDRLLEQVGPRLRAALPSRGLLARLGGDEFAVLLPHTGLDAAHLQAERLRDLMQQPFTVEGVRLHVGVSIGIATAPVPAATVTELLRCADVAMYAAKKGQENIRAYVPDPGGGTGDRLRSMEELRTALAGNQLLVHLQPQVSGVDGAVVGVEALVRWQHPTRGLLSPVHILPPAEQAGLLGRLTDIVLDCALGACAQWWPERRVPVSVNLSAANVTDLDLPDKILAALSRHGLPPAALTLELVEDTLMADPDRGRTVLGELRRLGVRTSIDDYGTGYSSLAYLRHLPADELKLDRSLTLDVGTDSRATAIVRHTVALAHELGLSLVAEGVEDDQTARTLTDLGCDVLQGYAIARPMPVTAFVEWLHTRTGASLPRPRPGA